MTLSLWWTFFVSCLIGGLLTIPLLNGRLRRQRLSLMRRGAAIREAARAIVQSRRELCRQRTVPDILSLACRQLVDSGLAQGAFIALRVYDELRVIGSAGRVAAIVDSVFPLPPGSESSMPGTLDACLECFLSGKPTAGHDPTSRVPDAASPAWRFAAHRAGLRSQLVVPIRIEQHTFAVLSVYGDRPSGFDDALSEMIESFSIDVAFAVQMSERASKLRLAVEDAQGRAEQLHQVFDACPISILIMSSPQSRIVFVNRAVCERHGFSRSDMIGKTMRELNIGLLEPERQRAWYAMMRDGSVRNMELMQRDHHGEVGPVLLSLTPMSYFGESCTLVTSIDISQVRATQSRANDRLVVEAANQAKTAFLTRLGQQLRAPLNAVIGFTQMLLDESHANLTAQDLSRIEHIRQGGSHLLSLTNDILDMSSIETGRMPVVVEALLLAPELDFALTLSGPPAIGAEVTLHADYRGMAPVAVEADPLRLRQVMLNLLSNAIKYNRRGGQVWVNVQIDGADAHIDVVDNGIGMTGAQLNQLFEPFNRLGRDRHVRQGLGIGLVVSRELVRLMGGRLEVDSHPGSGTCFRVTLKHRPLPSLTDADIAPMPTVADRDLSGRVLYVGSHPDCALRIRQWLQTLHGVRYLQAGSGAEAMASIGSQMPDVVLLDLPLPDVDGMDLLDRIERQGNGVAPRIVVMTCDESRLPVERALRHGAIEFWTKPLEAARVLASVTAMLA